MVRAPKRVLLTTDVVGGVWTYALDLARSLSARGVEVVLAVLGGRLPGSWRAEAESIPYLRVEARPYKLEWMSDPWDDVARSSEWLFDLASRFRPEIVHLNQFSFGAVPWPMPAIVVAHSDVLSWWRAVRKEEPPLEWGRYRDAVRRGLSGARLMVTPTLALLRSIRSDYGPLSDPRVIPNGRDASRFAPGEKEPFILGAGRLWDDAKNLVALDRVARRLPWPVRLAGGTWPPEGAPRSLTHAAVLGHLAEPALAEAMSRAAIFAHPALYEPFGLSPLEAALSGCALVLGDIPSLREVWGEAARFVPPDDDEALAAALRELIEDGEGRHRLARRARTRALSYSPARMAERYLEAYEDARAVRHVMAAGMR